jgi:plastocyanin
MQKHLFRHGLLVGACCLALCYLLVGNLPAASQTPPPLPTTCLPVPPASTPPPNCHVVHVGPPSQQKPFGEAFFEDLDSGSRSDDPAVGGQNPVITVIPVGHTIQWQFFYSHSSTAGNCVSLGGACNPNGQWDSGIKSGNAPTPTPQNLHTVQFNQPGVFTYFCGVHFTLMRGIVVVLSNNQDYDLFANPDPTLGPPLPTPTLTIFAGDQGNFNGTLNFYNRFGSIPGNTLTLTCSPGGTPRNPTGCPSTATTVIPIVPPIPKVFATTTFNFPVSEAAGGTYLFDIVANPQPPLAQPFSHRKTVQLNVNDLGLTLASSSLTALRGDAVQTTAQVRSLSQFTGSVTMSCSVSPPGGPGCNVTPSSFPVAAGATQNLTINLSNTTVASNNYTFNVVASSSAVNPGPGVFTRSKNLGLALKAAERLVVTPLATSVAPGNPLSVIVKAVDGAGNQMTNYNGTVQLTSSDPAASLPGPQTFNAADNGLKIISVTLNTVGPRSITGTDTTPFSTTGTSSLIRVDEADTDNTMTLEPNPAPLRDAFFQNEQVTFIATVTGTSGSPVGTVQFYDGGKPVGTPVALTGSGSTKTATKTFTFTVGDHAISAVFLPSSGSFTTNMSDTLMQRRFPSPRCVNNVCPGSH